MVEDEELLIAVLNSAPVIGGQTADALTGESGLGLMKELGGTGLPEEREQVRQVRDALQDVVRGRVHSTERLAEFLDDAVLVPHVSSGGINWVLRVDPDRQLPVRIVMAWSKILHDAPGRLRPCANDECNLFLIDRSRPGTAKWCSMTTCGNRMKARAHASRQAKNSDTTRSRSSARDPAA